MTSRQKTEAVTSLLAAAQALEAQASEADALEQTLKIGSQLNPKLWDEEDRLRPDVKELLTKLAKDFSDGFDYPLSTTDIIVTGSSANYNWNRFSDIDLHLVVDYASLPDEYLPAFLDYADAKRRNWNKEHDIMIHGHEVEMYVQPEGSELKAAGIYSIVQDKWLAKPDKTKTIEPDRETIAKKSRRLRYLVSVVAELVDSDPEVAFTATTALKEKIRKLRAAGLSKGGEQSSENLAFKVLRNDGTLALLDDLHRRAYDLANSVG